MNGSKAMDKVKSSFRKLKGLSRRKKAGGAVALVAAVAVGSQLLKGFGSADAATEYTEYTVQRGSITTSISGSGTVEPLNSYNVVAGVRGEVLSDTFEEGDRVEVVDEL